MQLAMKKARVGSRAGARPNGYRRVRPRTRKPTPSHGAEGLQRIGRAQTPGAEGGGVLGRRDWEGLKEPSIDLGLFLSGFQAGVGDVCEKRSDTRRNTDEETDGACGTVGQMCATVGSVPTGYISNAGGSDDAGCLRGHRGAKCVPHRSRGLITRPARARTPRPPPLLRLRRQYRNAPAFPDRRINRNGHYRDRARSPSARSRAVDSAHRRPATIHGAPPPKNRQAKLWSSSQQRRPFAQPSNEDGRRFSGRLEHASFRYEDATGTIHF
ncbi:unnamed protein product [Lampetra planeri]